jgi:tetratricopeptide (TPR) repeat protein
MPKKIQNKNNSDKASSPPRKASETKKLKTPWWFYFVQIAIPVLFFVILEILLRIFNYGYDYTQWVNVTKDKYILNPELTRKYFYTTSSVPISNGNMFDVQKAENAYRVFILGESSAAGYPFSPNGDFGKYIRKRLELNFPDKKIEVINLGITAINTYTIRDIFPGVIDQKPDLVLIYTGHNEYYGALGIGSSEFIGSSRKVVNFVLWLNKFKTTQLVRNIMKWGVGLFSSNKAGEKSGTLMSRMAKDQYIEYDSPKFNAGLEQFEGNMKDILDEAASHNVKVILGTLTSNLRSQYPFVSVKGKYPQASFIYNEANQYLGKDNQKADSLFRYAKDLDALRFRGSEKMNKIIRQLAYQYKYPLVNIDSIFAVSSPYGITGDNLMTDHLHPTLEGYQLIGKSFFEVMQKGNFLPGHITSSMAPDLQDSFVKANYNFSHLDSVIARYRIIVLKNDWPFTEPKSVPYLLSQMKPGMFIDTLALKVLENSVDWEKAHRLAASYYFSKGDYKGFTDEMLVLIDQFPIVENYYSSAEDLLEKKQYDLAKEILVRKYKIYPDALSTKWIGIISLSRGDAKTAIKYLSESLEYNGSDEQVIYNLAGAYSTDGQFQKGLETINKCLSINPSFPGAVDLRNQLVSILNQKK